ncbi:PilZ domain-containing protein [Thalassomonas actiniarum]|uniref:PilZ domain-containing protein n=1 Tax=Thalassomonas actiniarum TaxID=485447 RepID=A0AAE9YTK7_9GAMM|nr:PilZ domain-containing protein [Thalassomonas actiniarum]WDE00069.1 PilZ domain-containing protein [Thalassomonas actiniarum]
MTKDFSQYQNIISQFRGRVANASFEAEFNAATEHLAKTEKFLLKMELKRLATPCTRLIDLRGHVDGDCRPYEHDGSVHFLDAIAIKVFEENLGFYGDYTLAVYEAVNNTENNFRVIYQKEKAQLQLAKSQGEIKPLEKNQYPATLYRLGEYHNRREERMNFAVPLLVILDDDTELESTSSDISVHGCKFRLPAVCVLNVGQVVGIRFVGLEQEFQFGFENSFNYEVLQVQEENNQLLVSVKRVDAPADDSFIKFLRGFIQGNKRRYKINLDNTINALQARSMEQFVLPKSNELPVFVEENQGQLVPRYVLTSGNNQPSYQYWQDEKHQVTLHCLINKDRIERLQKKRLLENSLLVYSFIHYNQGKSYFYSADEEQLKDDKDFMKRFLGFAAARDSFAITELSFFELDASRAYSPFTLSDSLTKKDEYLNLPPSQEVFGILGKLPYIVVANNITDERLVEDYRLISYEGIDINQLKNFGHKRLSKPYPVDELGINYRNQRQEPRFNYKTPVIIESEGVSWQGISHDFSVSGLMIELDKPAVLKKGDIVHLSFPKLQKITSTFDLKSLPYETVCINKKKTIINLRVYVEQHQHIGRSFFKLLIEKNRDKLTADEYAMIVPGLSKALRNVYSHSLNISSLVVQTSGSRYKIEAIACSAENNELLSLMRRLSDRQQYYNLYPLLSNLQATNIMNNSLKKMQTGDEPITEILYVAINHDVEMVEKAVMTKLASELKSTDDRKTFIRDALKAGSFYCVQVKLSRADEPDMDYLNPELSYIGSYAIHRGKQIEQEIWSVAGVIQLLDITHEAMIRYNFVPEGVHSSTLL